jgi:thioesterase domain-containing protein
MVPSVVMELEGMPLTANGKLDRRRLPKPEARIEEEQYIAPRTAVESYLQGIWQEVLLQTQVSVTSDFFELGGHSLSAVSLAARISRLNEPHFPVRAVFDYPTIEKMAIYLTENLVAASSSRLLLPLRSGGNRRFFCIHPAGGLANCYLPLATHMGEEVSFYGIDCALWDMDRYPSLDVERLSSNDVSVEGMARRYITEISKVQPVGPYLLGGWSFGGLVAFEMAQQLMNAGEHVQLLALMDSVPRSHGQVMPIAEAEVRSAEEMKLAGSWKALAETPEMPGDLSYEERLRLYFQAAQRQRTIPPGISEDHLARFWRIQALIEKVAERYLCKPYCGKITLFRGKGADGFDGTYGWELFSDGGIDVIQFEETHDKFVAEPTAQYLAEQLMRRINECSSRAAGEPIGVAESRNLAAPF